MAEPPVAKACGTRVNRGKIILKTISGAALVSFLASQCQTIG